MSKRLFMFMFALFPLFAFADRGPTTGCSFMVNYGCVNHEFELWGEVYVNKPESGADVQVYLAKEGEMVADLVIKWVAVPSLCGEWHRVYDEKKADFTVSFVKDWHDADLIVMYGEPKELYSTTDPF